MSFNTAVYCDTVSSRNSGKHFLLFKIAVARSLASEARIAVMRTVRLLYRSVEDFDLYVLRFNDYGKEFPKSQNMSPDAFIQLALQLTYYKSV